VESLIALILAQIAHKNYHSAGVQIKFISFAERNQSAIPISEN